MGFFSWKTSDSGEPIRNRFTDQGATPVKMLLPDGTEIIEMNYMGYGEFGGHRFYNVVMELNGVDEKTAIRHEHKLITPKLVTLDCKERWQDLPRSENDPAQGFF